MCRWQAGCESHPQIHEGRGVHVEELIHDFIAQKYKLLLYDGCKFGFLMNETQAVLSIMFSR
jgi:hypothetical protein